MLPVGIVDSILQQIENSTGWPTRVTGLSRMLERLVPGHLPAGLLRSVQQRRLRQTIRYAARTSPYYRDLFARTGIRPGDIRTVEDLRHLPLTPVEALRDWRQFLCVDDDQVSAIFTTSGTTGEPKRMLYTARDLRRGTNLAAIWLRYLCPSRPVAFLALPTDHGLWVGMPMTKRIMERAGGLTIPIGVGDPKLLLRWMQRMTPNVICSSPSYLTAFTREAERVGYRTPLHAIFLVGELLTLQHQRWLEAYWEAPVYNIYGSTEIGGVATLPHPGCTEMHLNDLHLVVEILDPATGTPADEGELVVTTLLREGMPLLRYRTGDHARWTLCADRLPFATFQILGRLDDLLVTGDMNLSGSLIAEAIAAIPGATGRIAIRLDKVMHIDRLTIQVEGHGVQTDAVRQALYALYPQLAENSDNGLLILEIHPEALLADQMKPLRILDQRMNGDEAPCEMVLSHTQL